MATSPLKVKVLFAYGTLIAGLGLMYAPQFAKHVLPLAFCVVSAVILMNAVPIMDTLLKYLRRRIKASSPQATKNPQGAPRSIWCDHIDYDNYYIPTYLRRQEEV